jgi:hypothetical protein
MTGPDARQLAHHFEEGRRGETNFTAKLFALLVKADPDNRERIRAGFPNEVAWWETWMASPNGEQWMQAHLDGRLDHNDYERFAIRATARTLIGATP